MRRRRPACKLGSCLGSSTRGSGHFVRFAVMLNQPVSLRFASQGWYTHCSGDFARRHATRNGRIDMLCLK